MQSACQEEDWDGWLCKAHFKAVTGIGDMIQGNRVMWLCRAYLRDRVDVGGCARHVLTLE